MQVYSTITISLVVCLERLKIIFYTIVYICLLLFLYSCLKDIGFHLYIQKRIWTCLFNYNNQADILEVVGLWWHNPIVLQMITSRHLLQVAPVNPFWQLQIKESILSSQIPPFWQGLGLQSSVLVWQLSPVNPWVQAQENEFISSWHVPPLRHGLEAQTLLRTSQFIPL